MKREIEIEKLLQWSVREELPKGCAVASSAWDLISQYAALGTRVQTSGGSPDGLGFVDGEPHEDALTVAAAVRRLPTEASFQDADHVRKLFGEFASIADEAIKMLALAIFNPRALVISCAALSKRPAWQFEAPTPYPTITMFRDSNGALRDRELVVGLNALGDLVTLEPRKSGGRAAHIGRYDFECEPRSPISWRDPELIKIGEARADYFAWHRALEMLVADLDGKLVQCVVLPPSARPMPWLTGQTPDPVVLSDGRSSGNSALPLKPKRHAPGKPVESDIERRHRLGRRPLKARADAKIVEATA